MVSNHIIARYISFTNLTARVNYHIGDAAALKSKFAHSKWEGDEQKGANAASDETLQQLAKLNAEYLEKNGFIFLICATGKTADEMVAALEERMTNDSKTEVSSDYISCY